MDAVSLRMIGCTARVIALATALAVAGAVSAADDDFRIESWQGPVESLDATHNTMVVGGVRYDVASDVHVQLGGSYGALSMMSPGMNVKILVKRYLDTGRREIIDVDELPAGVAPEQY